LEAEEKNNCIHFLLSSKSQKQNLFAMKTEALIKVRLIEYYNHMFLEYLAPWLPCNLKEKMGTF
jgi:hypothetical protein